MNELATQELSNSLFVRSRIFTIRGVQVMLDEVKCCQCDSVANTQVQFSMGEENICGRKFRSQISRPQCGLRIPSRNKDLISKPAELNTERIGLEFLGFMDASICNLRMT